MKYFESHPLSILGFFAIPLLLFVYFMGLFFPNLSINGFQNAIIALEFISTQSDIELLFAGLIPENIRGLDTGNYIDFGFMVVYSGFFFCLFVAFQNLHQFEYARIGQFLAIAMLLGDTVENLQLLEITGLYPNAHHASLVQTITILKYSTWTKWLCIAISLALVGTALWEYYGFGPKIFALVLSIPIVLGGHALVKLQPFAIELFTSSIFITIALLVISCFFLRPVILKTKA